MTYVRIANVTTFSNSRAVKTLMQLTQIDISPITKNFTTGNFPMLTLTEKVKAALFLTFEFQYIEELNFNGFSGYLRRSDSDPKEKYSHFSIKYSCTSAVFLNFPKNFRWKFN